MSVPGPLKATSISVTNTLSARSAYLQELQINNVDVMEQINFALNKITELETKLESLIKNGGGSVDSVKGETGEKGKNGERGKNGTQGKIGERGLKGTKGEKGERGASIEEFREIFNMDIILEDGMGIIWSAKEKKWKAQTIFE